MSRLQDLSIRNKLVGIIAITTITFLAIGFAIDVFFDLRAFRRELIDQTVAITRVTAEHSVAELAFLDADAAAETLSKLRTVPTIEGAYLHDVDGELFASYQRNEDVPDDVDQEISGPRIDATHIRVTEPVRWEGENYGTLTVLSSTVVLRERVADYLTTMGVVLLLLLVGSVFVALRLEKVISRPILRLASTARKVSEEHDYSIRFPKSADDEIGQLSDSFNDMLIQIEKRQTERDEANQRTREKSQFLANMSHELRTPLNAIIGFSEILRGRLGDRVSDKEEAFLENIAVSGHHLLSLVNDILDLSKIEAGKLEINPEPTNVEESIESICNLMRGVSAKRGVELIVDVPPSVPNIEADPGKLKQILYNLLSNALKFSTEGARVWMSARKIDTSHSRLGEESVSISVRDEGVGIAPEDHELIFREFQQLDTSLVWKFGGSGLGLALVLNFTEAHGGLVDVESELGEGSTFTVTLPVAFRGAVTDVDHLVEISSDSLDRDIVVIIEENAGTYLGWKRELLEAGYHPIWARTGQEGIAVIQRLRPAALVVDPLIREVDVWHVIATLLSGDGLRDVPVIVASFDQGSRRDLVIEPNVWACPDVASIRDAIERDVEVDDRSCLAFGDDQTFLKVVGDALKPVDIRMETTDDSRRVISRLQRSPESLILVQVEANEYEGLRLIQRARKYGERVSIVAVIPDGSSSLDLKAMEEIIGKLKPARESLVDVIRRTSGGKRSGKGLKT
ncbi:MAG: ATP-binding protein [Thermoanaerobaculia bacterium]|nr:ATP-binding protein [Thermoanaerobaculia bacterium]